MHEAQMHQDNCFLTLTYNTENLPENNSLDKRHYQLFMKRLRKAVGEKIRYFQCGEYGEKNERPHYHALLFGYEFNDKKIYKETANGDSLYTSQSLDALWSHGQCYIGEVTFKSAAYVARYVIKKVSGDRAEKHYRRVNLDTGEVFQLHPEYITMSRRPGIGKPWLERYQTDVYPSDNTIVNGRQQKVPSYYDTLLEKSDPDLLKILKIERLKKAQKHLKDNTKTRLKTREKFKINQLKQLRRDL